MLENKRQLSYVFGCFLSTWLKIFSYAQHCHAVRIYPNTKIPILYVTTFNLTKL